MSAQPPSPRRKTARQIIDLGQMLSNPDQLAKLEFARPETPEEREVRLNAAKINMWFETVRNGVILVFVIVGVAAVLWYCLSVMWNPAASLDEKRWAQTILGSAVSAGLGYLLGKRA